MKNHQISLNIIICLDMIEYGKSINKAFLIHTGENPQVLKHGPDPAKNVRMSVYTPMASTKRRWPWPLVKSIYSYFILILAYHAMKRYGKYIKLMHFMLYEEYFG